MVALNTDSKPTAPLLTVERFSYGYPGEDYLLQDISLNVGPGECHLIQGSTGSGKTTLLMAIKGVLPPGNQQGKITITDSHSGKQSQEIGLVLQNPKMQLLCESLGAEVAFGLENQGYDPALMADEVIKALNQVGLDKELHVKVDSLSMGQKYRACIAGQLVMEPSLLLLDEPMAQLDNDGRQKLIGVIAELKRKGRTIVISEHLGECLSSVVDHRWFLDNSGRLHSAASISVNQSEVTTGKSDAIDSWAGGQNQQDALETVMSVDSLKWDNAGLDHSSLSFSVARGESIGIYGVNGSGKTTLIRTIAGLLTPSDGKVTLFGARPKPVELRNRVALLFQEPGKQLFETTVYEEVSFAAKRAGLNKQQCEDWVTGLLQRLQLSHMASVSPHTLSYGQKHLVGLVAVLAAKPEILLLDDPFAGVDSAKASWLVKQLAELAKEHQMTIIWTSHDSSLLATWVEKVIYLPEAGAASSAHEQKAAVKKSTPRRSQRIPTGVMLAVCLVLSMAAFAARTPTLLTLLTTTNILLLLSCCPKIVQLLKKSVILFFWQAALIVLLYCFRFGAETGGLAGLQVAWQLFLAFWPGMIFMGSNSQPRIVRTLSRFLPQRIAFVSATCLRFLPVLLLEVQKIREVQLFRGARLGVSDLKNPRYWSDWLKCLMVPTLIRTLTLASDIALAATIRGFGTSTRRTAWPND